MSRITSYRELAKALDDQGFVVVKARNGHYKVYLGERLVTSYPSTPSDWRGIHNLVSHLRKHGFVVPETDRKKAKCLTS